MSDDDRTLDILRSLIHARPPEPRRVCSANRRDKWGRRVAECSFQPGHENDHRDVHVGRTWK
ncbi:hypothetical protein [Georgenia thermotolerans]|uniref:Uncharacterized protein n=1 Tax=Georgenia thermotolerans TaxID=527326 RepID=A0A7J5ULG6_9MICO|nr:hypothetical protein [Georgenia thermotolerans]KAE8763205.1 hypothetical protein GB883_15425 [Georgenia thermotolerans]